MLPRSLQQAATLDVLVFVRGREQLDGLFVDQSPEVLKGNVLTVLHTHLLQKLSQSLLLLHRLQEQKRGDQLREKSKGGRRREEKRGEEGRRKENRGEGRRRAKKGGEGRRGEENRE